MNKIKSNPFTNKLVNFFRKNLITEFRFFIILKFLKNPQCKILDIGCGNYSVQRTKLQYPKCHYYGLDRARISYNSKGLVLMDGFYELDLNSRDYSKIPDDFFDLIIFSHILEHLPQGEKTLIKLMPKLKKNGLIYIEYPSIRSTRLPHRRGTLNFYDDPEHVSLYTNDFLIYILEKKGFRILKEGIRRDFRKIIFLPFIIIYDLIKYRRIKTGHLWDLFGFANYIIARRNLKK
ncbi:MAG: methyltransferase domain-containing protein [Promethearchaeota archaeon]